MQSHFIESEARSIHVMQIGNGAVPVAAIHGSLENGRIFYSKNGKGLAPWLAKNGCSVYVADWLGKGLSRPHVSKGFDVNQADLINSFIPALFRFVKDRHQERKLNWITHSWGGTLLNAALIRHPGLAIGTGSVFHTGAKRRIRVQNPEKWFKIDLIWALAAPAIARGKGFFPARSLKIGADDESPSLLRDTLEWIRNDQWTDAGDGFDYTAAIPTVQWPRMKYATGIRDVALAQVSDVMDFMKECGHPDAPLSVVGKRNGYSFDAGHVDILVDLRAEKQFFPEIRAWMQD